MTTHESAGGHREVKLGSDRSYGVVFFVVFAIIGAYPVISGGQSRVWALAVAVAFLLVALVRPNLLHPLNRLWFRFGLLLHCVVTPIIMAVMFYLVVLPVGLAVRLTGKDLLALKLDSSASTYWVKREPVGPDGLSMHNQF